MKRLLAPLVAIVLSGCASGYAEFYQAAPTGLISFLPYTGDPQVVQSSGTLKGDIEAMFTQGYGPLGYASFNGPMQNVQGAIAQAKKVGAKYITVSSQYASTVTGAIPITTFSPQTTYSSGTVYGGGGSVNYSGTSTSYNPQTTYVPYAIQRYDQSAGFFGPLARTGIGVDLNDISPEQASSEGSNKGALVVAIRRESPAFLADIVPGDVILSVDGQTVYGREAAMTALRARYGSTASLELRRHGAIVVKALPLPAGGQW